jgi:2,4-dienoyl-CoA reductase-like NADH-dependent reductase (Old Yellow Enzyme family)
MASPGPYGSVFEPLEIKGVKLRNRIARGAHNVGLPWVDSNDDLIAYHEARAKGEVALSILGIAGVHRLSPTAIPVMTDDVIAGYQKLVSRTEAHGMKLFQQLWHGGPARSFPPEQPWSASDRPNPTVGVAPRPMTISMIDEVVGNFAAAARRCKAGGIHGVELHAAHGYLIAQFLSPATNVREDSYGGSLENRTRFLREIIAAVRGEVGDDYPVGIRLSSDEQVDGGLTPQDTLEIARLVEPSIDFLDLSLGGYYRFDQMFATMDSALGYELPASGFIGSQMSVPVIVTGRIMTLDVAENVLRSGAADMVSMVRPLVADPELVKKTRQGRSAQVRPCIGTNEGCLGQFFAVGRMGCVVNPTVTREASVSFDPSDRVATPKRVVVIGGGPAGLEAARNLAIRGHHVDLYDMARQLGGQVRIAAAAPHRSDIGAIASFLASEVRRLGVGVHLGRVADPDFIRGLEPDEVIIAAGSTPRDDGFQAFDPAHRLSKAELARLSTSWELLGFGGTVEVAETALVYDDTGSYEAISAAEALIEAGAKVKIATRHDNLGGTTLHHPSVVFPALRRLAKAGVEVIPVCTIKAIDGARVTLRLIHGAAERDVTAQTIVMVGYNTPNRENADELVGVSFPVHVIGDAAGTRTIAHAIEQGSAIGRSI